MSVFDDILKAIQGRPAQGGLYFPDTVLPPFYNTMSQWGPTISGLWDRPLPQWGGNFDPGMSPTMQNFMQMMQGNAMQGPNSAMQGAQGVLGQYAKPGAGMMGQNDIMSARNALMRYQNPQWMNAGNALQQGGGKGQNPNYGPGSSISNYPMGPGGAQPPAPPQSKYYTTPQGGYPGKTGYGNQAMGQTGGGYQTYPGQGGAGQQSATIGGYPMGGNRMLQGGDYGNRMGGGGGSLMEQMQRYANQYPQGNPDAQTMYGKRTELGGAMGGGQQNLGALMAQLFGRAGGMGQQMGGGTTNPTARTWQGTNADLSANPFGAGGAINQQAAAARYGTGRAGGNAPGTVRPLAHGAGYASMNRLGQDMASGKLPPGVQEILSRAGIGGGQLSPLGYTDLTNFSGGGNNSYLGDIDKAYEQDYWHRGQGVQDLAEFDRTNPTLAAQLRQQYGIGGSAPPPAQPPPTGQDWMAKNSPGYRPPEMSAQPMPQPQPWPYPMPPQIEQPYRPFPMPTPGGKGGPQDPNLKFKIS